MDSPYSVLSSLKGLLYCRKFSKHETCEGYPNKTLGYLKPQAHLQQSLYLLGHSMPQNCIKSNLLIKIMHGITLSCYFISDLV